MLKFTNFPLQLLSHLCSKGNSRFPPSDRNTRSGSNPNLPVTGLVFTSLHNGQLSLTCWHAVGTGVYDN